MEREVRGGIKADVRAKDDGGMTVTGYAAVFNEETDIGGMFREVIEPGAFADAIGRDDVVFLINHEGLPLARTRGGNGTLKLEEDERGLKITADLSPDDPDVQRIAPKMKRGDLDKMSFAFYPEVQEWDDSGETPLRRIKRVSLADVSIVTTPAYNGTEIALRSLEAARKDVVKQETAQEFRLRMKGKLIG